MTAGTETKTVSKRMLTLILEPLQEAPKTPGQSPAATKSTW